MKINMANGTPIGIVSIMVTSMQWEKDSRERDSRVRVRVPAKAKVKGSQGHSRDNATHVENTDIRQGSAHMAMAKPKAQVKIRQSAITAAMQDTLQPTARRGKAKARQPIG